MWITLLEAESVLLHQKLKGLVISTDACKRMGWKR